MPHGYRSILMWPDRCGSTRCRLYLSELEKLRVGHINHSLRSLLTSLSSRDISFFFQLLVLICRVFYTPELIKKIVVRDGNVILLYLPNPTKKSGQQSVSQHQSHVIHNGNNQNSPIQHQISVVGGRDDQSSHGRNSRLNINLELM